MSATTRTVPVILCGKTAKIADGVRAALRPQYEVVQVFTDQQDAQTGIQKALTDDSISLAERIRAVIFGGAFNDDNIQSIKSFATSQQNARKIAWLQHAPLEKPREGPLDKEKYGQEVSARIKSVLDELKNKGKLEEGDDEVYQY
ncbi:hypothetical protein IE81DRAFT_61720 [Ceraceosorus guamensis]|uniref:Uncharacterized protein n=1 Tax=Ceraceosorus guamensis TaxID=1522189 RepID=A0A316W2Y3_9BASI|nr:hypothetical protein IE81DRAFT_61720 [Ceraceosorus guamensis]PWN43864.1 hypothetical protein IE81DRAFT_61720 [Ceraceosorus guamensis]